MRSLVIDDEFVAVTKMVAMLDPLGPCDVATNSQQALALFRKAIKEACPYRLVTIDINLPDTDGLRLLGHLQAEEKRHGATRSRKLMVSAESTASNVFLALTGECDGFLVKPVRRTVLLEKLASLGLLTRDVARHAAGEPVEELSSERTAEESRSVPEIATGESC